MIDYYNLTFKKKDLFYIDKLYSFIYTDCIIIIKNLLLYINIVYIFEFLILK